MPQSEPHPDLRVCIHGFGLMGQGLLSMLGSDPRIRRVDVVDQNADLARIHASLLPSLSALRGGASLGSDFLSPTELDEGRYDLVYAMTPWPVTCALIQRCAEAATPVISITRPTDGDVDALDARLRSRGVVAVVAAGLEPGLVDCVVQAYARAAPSLASLEAFCGGVALPRPENAFGYKSLFGGTYLPFARRPALAVSGSEVVEVPRFSGVTQIELPGVGVLEAFHDGMSLSTARRVVASGVARYSQKTLRWPGYAAAVEAYHADPTAPAALHPAGFALEPGEDNLTLLLIRGATSPAGEARTLFELRARPSRGMNSMAVATTAFAAGLLHSLLEGDVPAGLHTPDALISPADLPRLFAAYREHCADLDATPL